MSDRHSIHKILIKRLVIATLVIAALLAGAVYLIDRQQLRLALIERSVEGAAQLMDGAGSLLAGPGPIDRDGVQRQLEALARNRSPASEGRMVVITVYDAAGAVAAHIEVPDYPLSSEATTFLSALSPPTRVTEPEAKTVKVGQVEHLVVHLPLSTADGRWVGQAVGLFAISERYLAEMTQRIRRTVATAVAIVLVTTALLYPVIVRLTRRLAALSVNLLDANLQMLRVLGSAIAKRDADTDVHN